MMDNQNLKIILKNQNTTNEETIIKVIKIGK